MQKISLTKLGVPFTLYHRFVQMVTAEKNWKNLTELHNEIIKRTEAAKGRAKYYKISLEEQLKIELGE